MLDYLDRPSELRVIERVFISNLMRANNYMFLAFVNLEAGDFSGADLMHSIACTYVRACASLADIAADGEFITGDDWQSIRETLSGFATDFLDRRYIKKV